MKTHIFKTEYRRMIGGAGMKTAVLMALVIAVWEHIEVTLPIAANDAHSLVPESNPTAPMPLWTQWLGGELLSLPSYLYRLLLPVFAALPYAASYGNDVNNGYIRQLLIRTDKHRYLRAKLFVVWFGGGAASVLPLIFSFLLATTVLPFRGPDRSNQNMVGSAQIFGDLYANTPLVYLLLTSLLIFAFCGAMALIALFVSLYIKNTFLILVTPFTLYLGADVIARRITPIDADRFLPMQFLHPYQWMPGHPEIVFTELILLLLLFGGGFYVTAAHRDTI